VVRIDGSALVQEEPPCWPRGCTVPPVTVARAPGSNLTQTLDAGLPDARYADVLADIEARVDAARVLALRAANAELMSVYWHVGRHIAEQEDAAPVKRGPNAPKVVGRLSADLRAAYPDTTGFSPRNLRYMREFSRAWTEEEMVQRGVATLPWGHIIELLGIRDTEVRDWYVERAGEWTRPVLQHHICQRPVPRAGGGTQQLSSRLCLPVTPRQRRRSPGIPWWWISSGAAQGVSAISNSPCWRTSSAL